MTGPTTKNSKSLIPIGDHYEAYVNIFMRNDTLFVEKTYRDDVACICWLNEHLSTYYDPTIALPVAQHEFAALKLLEKYQISPLPISLNKKSIVMQFCGIPFQMKHSLSKKAYFIQCQKILSLFEQIEFFHNDLLPQNLLIDGQNQLKVIDFTLAEFGGISIMNELPDQKWARAYQDRDILENYSSKKRLSFFLKKLFSKYNKTNGLSQC